MEPDILKPRTSRKRTIAKLLGLLITVVCVVLLASELKWEEMRKALAAADYRYVVPAVFLYLAAGYVRAFRWKYLLRPIKKTTTSNLFPIVCIGYMANNILPLRMGEFVRAYVTGKNERISRTSSLATIVIERVFDGLTMLLFLAFVMLFINVPHTARWNALRAGANAAAVLFVGVFIGALLSMIYRERARRIVLSVLSRFPASARNFIEPLFLKFLDGLEVLRQKKDAFIVAITSIIVWLLELTVFLAIGWAFHIKLGGVGPGTIVMMLTLAVVNLGIMIPSSSGYIGVFEGLCWLALSLFQVPYNQAISFGLALHAVQFIPITLLGFYYLWKFKLRLRDIESQQPGE